MTFQILWRDAAQDELAAAWMGASPEQRGMITRATHLVEQDLKFNPQGKGESRAAGQRILFCRPLGVVFEVHEEDCRVIIEQVRVFRTP